MTHHPESLEQLARRLIREVRDALRRENRRYLRFAETIDGLRLTLGARESEETVEESRDLPFALRVSRPATRQVYRALRSLRGSLPGEAVVMPADVEARLRTDDPDTEPSRDTINHALRDLRDRELAWSHPERGWCLGCEQPRLPISAGQSDRASAADCRAYAGLLADRGVRRFTTEGSAMSKQLIWVPGEQSEYGVAVIDAETEAATVVSERIGEMRIESRTGRVRTVPAARGELLRVEGKHAVVRFNGREVRTRVLGEWQLQGLTAPEAVGVTP